MAVGVREPLRIYASWISFESGRAELKDLWNRRAAGKAARWENRRAEAVADE